MGVVSALGVGAQVFWEALSQGQSGIRPVTGFPPFRFPNGAQVNGFTASEHFDDKRTFVLDRFAQYALVAAREAVLQSGRTKFGAIVTGCSGGGQDAMDDGQHKGAAIHHHPGAAHAGADECLIGRCLPV